MIYLNSCPQCKVLHAESEDPTFFICNAHRILMLKLSEQRKAHNEKETTEKAAQAAPVLG